jgi:hypothetical protein
MLQAATETAAPAGSRQLLDAYETQFKATGSSTIFSGLPLPNGYMMQTTTTFISPDPGNGGASTAVTGLGKTLTAGVAKDGIVIGATTDGSANGGVANEIRIVSLLRQSVIVHESIRLPAQRPDLLHSWILEALQLHFAHLFFLATPMLSGGYHLGRVTLSTRAASTPTPTRPSPLTCGCLTPTPPSSTRSMGLAPSTAPSRLTLVLPVPSACPSSRV